MKYWQDYVRSSYELVLEAEGKTNTFLDNETECYLVMLLAKWFDKNDIPPETPVAILMMEAMQSSHYNKQEQLKNVGDICLFYDGFKIKQRRWPTLTYYQEMGKTAYGMAHLTANIDVYGYMETKFTLCSKILNKLRVE